MFTSSQTSALPGLGSAAPEFSCESTHGDVSLRSGPPGSWTLLLSHPADHTPVCTTELGAAARLHDEFAARNVRVLALSVDSLMDHVKWQTDIEEIYNTKVTFPILSDVDRRIATRFGLIHRFESHDMMVRAAIIIDPEFRIRLVQVYPISVGRSFEELLRVIDALQMADKHGIVTPADWYPGDKVVIRPEMPDDEAEKRYPNGFSRVRDYFRTTKID